MFTFSFGSAFAFSAGDAPDATSDSWFETLWAKYVDSTVTISSYAIDKSVVSAHKAEAKAAYDEYMKTATDYVTVWDHGYTSGEQYFGLKQVIEGTKGDGTLSQAVIDKAADFVTALAKAQFEADKADALAKLDTVPTYGYSTKVMSKDAATNAQNATKEPTSATSTEITFVDKDYTYQKAGEKLVEFFKDKINDVADEVDADTTVAEYKAYSEEVYAILLGGTGNSKTYTGAVYAVCINTGTSSSPTYVTTGSYDLKAAYAANKTDKVVTSATAKAKENTTDIVLYNTNSDWSAKGVDNESAIDNASIAAVKAQNASLYAAYISNSANDTTYAAKWLKVANILADEGWKKWTTNAFSTENGFKGWADGKYIAKPGDDNTGKKIYGEFADYISELEDYAAKYGAEKNASGQLVRDAAKVQKDLEDGIAAIATSNSVAAAKKAMEDAKTDIYNETSETVANELTFVKDSVKKAIELFVSDAKDDETYYAAELAKVEGYAATYTAKAEAATEQADAKEAYEDFLKKVDAVKTADELNNATNGWIKDMDTASTAAGTVYTAANSYLTYYNGNVAADTDAQLDGSNLKAKLADMIGESGARTNTDIKNLKSKVTEVVTALPTNSAVKAAKKAAEAAIDALPAKAAVTDLATVQAASDAIKAYADMVGDGNLSTKLDSADKTAYESAVTQLVNAYNTQFSQQVNKLTATDEAAINTVKADIKAAKTELKKLKNASVNLDFLDALLDTLNGNEYLGKIRDTEKDAVKAALNKIPLNVTEADKATVENARKLYDAYVAKYNDLEALYDKTTLTGTYAVSDAEYYTIGYAAKDFDISGLTTAEATLGLNEDPAAPVEALKLKASSTAKKGSITVKWTVTGDASTIDGYEIWKSTKANKGYKKAFTTTKTTYKNTKNLKKGTRYYYKVRAYKMIDGVKVTSDWSNKAYRKAK